MRYISLFSGIEAASEAWKGLGWQPVAFAEIEKFPSAVLAHRHPSVPNLGDMTAVDWARYRGLVDLVVGGSPCQSFSVAGLRKSLGDERGNLTLQYVRTIHAVKPRWFVWENVPGVLNTKDNAFGCFLAGLLGADAPLVSDAKGGKWAGAGVAVGEDYSLAWRVLDAQFFGVPQRRRRVFLVGHLGGWEAAAKVLLERQGVHRDPAAGGEAGQDVAGTLDARADGGGFPGTDGACAGHVVPHGTQDNPEVAHALKASPQLKHGADQDTYVSDVKAFGGNNTEGPIEKATACLAKGGSGRMDFASETFIAHTLKGEGFDASEDGTGRGVPLVPAQAPMAFSSKDHGADAGWVSPTLRAGGHKDSHQNAGVPPAVCYDIAKLWQEEGGTKLVGFTGGEEPFAYVAVLEERGSGVRHEVRDTWVHGQASLVNYWKYGNLSCDCNRFAALTPDALNGDEDATPVCSSYDDEQLILVELHVEREGPTAPAAVIPILEAGARTGKSTDDPRAGMGVGGERDPMFTLQATKQHAVAYDPVSCRACREPLRGMEELISLDPLVCIACDGVPVVFDTTQITSPLNYSKPVPGDPCHPLAAGAHPPAIGFYPTNRQPDAGNYPEKSPTVKVGSGSGGGNPPGVAYEHAMAFKAAGQEGFTPGDVCPPVTASDGGGAGAPTIAFQTRGSNIGVEEDKTGTLGSNADRASGSAPMVFEPRFVRNGRGAPEEIVPPLKAQSGETGKGDAAPVVFNIMPQNSGKDYKAREAQVAQPLMAAGPQHGNQGGDAIVKTEGQRACVRRLTPRECERLQGFPDDYTLIPNWKGKTSGEEYEEVVVYLLESGYGEDEARVLAKCPDGPRYKALGNSMAVPCMRFIGEGIQIVDQEAA